MRLVIDHISPVCQGGGNNLENLITACEDCNSGKGGKTIAQSAPTEQDRLRILQEHQEQMAVLQATIEAERLRDELRQRICNYFCEAFNREEMDKGTLSVISSYVNDFGAAVVYDWIDRARVHLPNHAPDTQIGRYISGIRRKCLEENK